MWSLLIYFVCFAFFRPAAQGKIILDVKTWTPDTNFDNPQNWDSGHLPCENQRAIFPSDARVASVLTTAMTISELILPLDGQIILTSGAELAISGGAGQSECPKKDVNFVVPNLSWYDPDNWNISPWAAFSSAPGSKNDAIPHAYRVPCRADSVIFPAGKSFKVYVEDSATVASLSINNVKYNNEEMSNFLVSQTGNLLFPGVPKITVTGNRCSEVKGCKCGNDEPEVLSRICRQKQTCPSLPCSDPVQPVGHCCKICGSLVVMDYEERFKMEILLGLHENYLKKDEFREVHSYTSRTHEEKIQTVFLDGGENKGWADDVARQVYDTILQDIKSGKHYKVRSVTLRSSTHWNAGVPVHGSYTGRVSAGGVVGILFAIIFILGSAAAVVYIYRKRQISGFSFARFDVNVGKIEVELGTTPHEVLQPDEPAQGEAYEDDKAFDNPVYGKASTSEKEKVDTETSPKEVDSAENPIFTLYEDTPDVDATES